MRVRPKSGTSFAGFHCKRIRSAAWIYWWPHWAPQPVYICNKSLKYHFAPPRLNVPIKTSRFSWRKKMLVLQRRLWNVRTPIVSIAHAERVSRKARVMLCYVQRYTVKNVTTFFWFLFFFFIFCLLFYIVEHLKKNVIWMLHAEVWCCGIV